MRLLSVVTLGLLSCGQPVPQQTLSTQRAPLCGSEPHDNGDGTVTMAGCAFEQQYENIVSHGQLLGGETLLAAGAPEGVTVTHRCGEWLLGADSAGVTVFVSDSTGEVRSHGQLHPGFATSSLPLELPLPVASEPP